MSVTSKGKNSTKEGFPLFQSFLSFQFNNTSNSATNFCLSFTFHQLLGFISYALWFSHVPYMPYSSYSPTVDYLYWVPSTTFGSKGKQWSIHNLLSPYPTPTHASAHTAFRISQPYIMLVRVHFCHTKLIA